MQGEISKFFDNIFCYFFANIGLIGYNCPMNWPEKWSIQTSEIKQETVKEVEKADSTEDFDILSAEDQTLVNEILQTSDENQKRELLSQREEKIRDKSKEIQRKSSELIKESYTAKRNLEEFDSKINDERDVRQIELIYFS